MRLFYDPLAISHDYNYDHTFTMVVLVLLYIGGAHVFLFVYTLPFLGFASSSRYVLAWYRLLL